jgi:hypothetical protein
MGPAVVRGNYLDVLVIPAPIRFLVFDPHIREMDLVVEVRQVVFIRPFTNLRCRPIGMAVVVVVVLVALVEPTLILALELVVEDDTFDVDAALEEPHLRVFVRAIDVEVVLEFPCTHQARVERLMRLVVAVTMVLEEAPPVLRQHHGLVAVPGYANGRDKATFSKVPQVAGPGIGRAIVVVAEVTTGDHSKGTDGRERA